MSVITTATVPLSQTRSRDEDNTRSRRLVLTVEVLRRSLLTSTNAEDDSRPRFYREREFTRAGWTRVLECTASRSAVLRCQRRVVRRAPPLTPEYRSAECHSEEWLENPRHHLSINSSFGLLLSGSSEESCAKTVSKSHTWLLVLVPNRTGRRPNFHFNFRFPHLEVKFRVHQRVDC